MTNSPERKRPAAIQRIDLGYAGLTFVRDELMEGGSLARRVAGMIQSGDAVFVPLDDRADQARAVAFETGTSMPTIAIRQWIADYIAARWLTKSCQIVFEDTWGTPDDMCGRPPKFPYFLVEATPYYAPQDNDLLAALRAGEKK